MVKRCLVTTADERTWPASGPILFLGEWCKKYSRKGHWENIDGITAEYHWNDRGRLYNDYKYIQNLYEDLLPAFSHTLNKYNNTNHDVNYWRIVAGPWLSSYISILFDRWSMIEYSLSNYKLKDTLRLDLNEKCMIPRNMSDFNSMYLKDEWNSYTYSKIIDYIGGVNVLTVPIENDKNPEEFNPETKKTFFRKKASGVKKYLGLLSGIIGKKNSIFFISSYFSAFNLLKLQIRTGQFPTIVTPISTDKINFTLGDRKGLSIQYNFKNQFEDLLVKLIPQQIPLVYLEGYKHVLDRTCKQNWPNNPKIILTAICNIYDDFFKIWAAEKIKQGSRLYIEQHGGHFGTGKFSSYEDHQLKISQFLSWGWRYNNCKNITPLPASKLINISKKFKASRKGGILLVTTALPRYSSHLMSIPIEASQYLKYEEDQMYFASLLDSKIGSRLTVRTFHEKFGCEQRKRWADRFDNLNMDFGVNSMKNSIAKNRLVISTQNSTTMLELLSANVPVVLFWDKEYWELNDTANSYYDELRNVGILHNTPQSAAAHVNEIWDKVEYWWNDKDTQNMRTKFCNKYAKTSENWLDLWQNVLKK